MNKKQMRALALEARDGLTKRQRADFSGVITEKLMKLPCYQNAKALLTYVSFRSEVDTVSLIRLALQEGKAVFAPKVLGRDMAFFRISSLDDLSPGYRGIWEPEAKTSYNDWISQNRQIQKKTAYPKKIYHIRCFVCLGRPLTDNAIESVTVEDFMTDICGPWEASRQKEQSPPRWHLAVRFFRKFPGRPTISARTGS